MIVAQVVVALLVSLLFLILTVAGFAVIFVYLPRHLRSRLPLTPMQRTIGWFALVGFLVPVVFEAKYAVTRTEILSLSVWVWPSSLMLMAVGDRSATAAEVVAGFTITHLSNVGLYAFVGWVFGWVRGKTRAKST